MPSWSGRNRFRLAISKEAEEDLARIGQQDPEAADDIRALLEWIQNDDRLLNRLLERGYGETRIGAESNAPFGIKRWEATWRGRNPRALWRLRAWDLDGYASRHRVIYLHQYQTHCFWVLGIVHRSFDYDENHEISQRIFRQADNLATE